MPIDVLIALKKRRLSRELMRRETLSEDEASGRASPCPDGRRALCGSSGLTMPFHPSTFRPSPTST